MPDDLSDLPPVVSALHADDLPEVLARLDVVEQTTGAPLVDEAERDRLGRWSVALARGEAAPSDLDAWAGLVARRGGTLMGYAGVVLPDLPSAPAVGDLAILDRTGPTEAVHRALLAGLEEVVASRASTSTGTTTPHLEVWLRRVQDDDLAAAGDAGDAGYAATRRLGVLGCALALRSSGELDVSVRTFRPEEDAASVVEVLAAAYTGTPDGGWDLARLAARQALPWFRPDDLLVAPGPGGTLDGLVWLKRRDRTTGEIYNLAIHPRAQGRGLGASLLRAGLDRLAATGHEQVLLWVDLANERAVRLYAAHGLSLRWTDAALTRVGHAEGSGMSR